jgi:salicylate hydroxylase
VTEPERVVVRSIRTGRTIGGVALGAFMRERFGAPYWVIHRSDLQGILLDAVRSEQAIRLLMGREAAGASTDETSARLTLASASGSQETLQADAIIGADGVWSRLRRAVGEDGEPAFRNAVAWRATLPRDRVPVELSGNETGLWLGRAGHVVHYPVAGGRLINVVAIQARAAPVDGWAAPGTRADLLARFADVAPTFRELLSGPDEWLLWSLYDRPARTLVRGRVALLGDAAHPVLPFLAQGAALAIEDAAVLAEALQAGPDLPHALEAYGSKRLQRVRRVQAQARRNGRLYHAGQPIAFARDQVMRRLGPEGMTERYAWLYGFSASS